jgi:hypothetical protein
MASDRRQRRRPGRIVPPPMGRRVLPVVLTVSFALGLFAGECRADRITLRGGGLIRGKVLPADPQHPDRVTILTATGKTPLNFQKAQVIQVQAEPSALDEYLDRRGSLATTAEANHALGVWCEEHKLKDLAEIHFEAAVRLDKAFEPAHQKLGHVLVGNQWLWGDELRAAQGLVRYKGQWMSAEEKEQREAAAASSAELASWVRRLKLLRQALLSGPEDRKRDAERQLMEIRDPAAVTPLVQVLGGEGPAVRVLLDHVLDQIPGPEAAAALVKHVLFETDSDVRHGIQDALAKRTDSNIVPNLVKALGSKDPAVVNRAGWSLGQLGAVATVPKLIPALITVQHQVILPPVSGWPSGGNESIGASFGSVAPTPGMSGGSPFLSGGISSYGVLTPPVAAPGAVAFGASAIPTPTLPGTGFSVGGGSYRPRDHLPRIIPLTFQNIEVLASLVKLTGQDFGYDIPQWKRWVVSGFRPDPTPVRRVPQP